MLITPKILDTLSLRLKEFRADITGETLSLVKRCHDKGLKLPRRLVDMAKRFEGLFLHAYPCPAGVFTTKFKIGWGHIGYNVKKGLIISKQQAEDLLIVDLINHLFPCYFLSPVLQSASEMRITAIGDFAFNLGVTCYKDSSLRKLVDAKQWDDAAKKILEYNKVFNPKTKMYEPLEGLKKRRMAESLLLNNIS